MRLVFVLPSFGISGGVYVVAKVAETLVRTREYEVILAVPDVRFLKTLNWIRFSELAPVLSYSDACKREYDIVLATWWETLFDAVWFSGKTYALFMQALESSFYRWGDIRQDIYDHLIESNAFPSITSSRWLLNYSSKPAFYFLAGLDRSVFKPVSPLIERDSKRVRFVLEGPITDCRKNIREAIDLLERNHIEYLWVGADASRAYVAKNCVAVFSSVPLEKMAGVYCSGDVLLKVSSSEGMFGPPLEMFSCGGTAISWDVSGAEEYMIHGHNSMLCPVNNFSSLLVSIEALRSDSIVLARLKANAKKTADSWPLWPEVAPSLVRCFTAISKIENRKEFCSLIKGARERFEGAVDQLNLWNRNPRFDSIQAKL